jgi:hypothetical protein
MATLDRVRDGGSVPLYDVVSSVTVIGLSARDLAGIQAQLQVLIWDGALKDRQAGFVWLRRLEDKLIQQFW